jgi:hypothetical protein
MSPALAKRAMLDPQNADTSMLNATSTEATHRHRRALKRLPDRYVVAPKCAICDERKEWRIEGRAYNKPGLCSCQDPEMCKV